MEEDPASVLYLEKEISKILLNDMSEDECKKSLIKLKEKNQLNNAYIKDHKLTDNEIKESFNNDQISATENQYKKYLTDEEYSKLKSNEIKEEDNLFFKLKDFPDNPIAISFIYSEVVYNDKIKSSIPIFKKELNKIDLNKLEEKNIYLGKSIEVLVEDTYKFDIFLKDKMTEEACFLKRKIFCWRQVASDGNCFYRSVMFSWLEYLIFNKKVSTLKIIIGDLHTKCKVETKKLSTDLNKQFTSEEKLKSIIILEIIIQLLDTNNIMDAYLTLLKAYKVTRVFDRIMVFYLRFIIYDFISNNKNKLFSKKFPVFLGNLLSPEYQEENGKFLYKQYFINNLLRYYTCPEKLAVYVIPYVLKINLNILFYYYGNDCQIVNKFFDCYLPDKDKKTDTINLLYRKGHYDIYYSKEYYNDFQPFLDLYCKINMKYGDDYFIVNPNEIKEKEKIINISNPFNPEDNIIYKKSIINNI